ncbi:MAG: hypothetical protein N4A33_07210 [Bacteriovoracaceae bacterium]|nr:hypothetical protein [Bacteriovoracaceae bacterium]
MTDELYFMVRYTPFWATPGCLIALELAYIFWIRKKQKQLVISSVVSTLCVICLGAYFIAGGPEKSVKQAKKFVRFISD